MNRHITALVAAAAALAFASCEKSAPVASEGNVINFSTALTPVQFTENGEPETRVLTSDHEGIAVYVTMDNLSDIAPETRGLAFYPTVADIDKFAVACHNGSSYEFQDGVYNLKTRSWVGTEHHFHGDPSKTLRFYTYTTVQGDPATAPVMNTTGSVPTITYSMPEAFADQHDLVAACSVASDKTTEDVELTFKHILSCIRIYDDIAALGYTIKYINFTGLYSQGTFALSKENIDPLSIYSSTDPTYSKTYWTNLSNKRDFSLTPREKNGKMTFNTPSKEVECMVIPQLTSGSYLRIGFVKEGEDFIQEASYDLSRLHHFGAGMHATFTIRIFTN